MVTLTASAGAVARRLHIPRLRMPRPHWAWWAAPAVLAAALAAGFVLVNAPLEAQPLDAAGVAAAILSGPRGPVYAVPAAETVAFPPQQADTASF